MSKIPLADGIFQTKVNITVKSKSARAGFEPSVWLNTGNVSGKILSEEKETHNYMPAATTEKKVYSCYTEPRNCKKQYLYSWPV